MAQEEHSVLRRLIAISLVAGSIVLLAIGLRGDSGDLAKRDYIAYWSAGQLLIHHGNPYSEPEVYQLEKSAGFKEASASAMLNPPWAMVFVLPLGFVNAYHGALFWIIAIVVAVMMSVRLLRTVNGLEDSQDHLLAYAFAPILACFMGGQMSGLACLSLCLFLYFIPRRPFLAGLCATVLAIKPHLFGILFLVLLFECIRKRDGRPILGTSIGVIVSTVIPLLFNHNLLRQYLIRDRLAEIGEALIPTFSFALRLAIHRSAFWVQFVPEFVAIAWAIWYYRRNRERWEWNRQGLLLVVVAVWAAPYSTFLDEVVLLPAVVSALTTGAPGGTHSKRVMAAFFVLNGIAFALLFAQVSVMSGAYIWTTTAWLLWYVYAMRSEEGREGEFDNAIAT